MRILLYTGKGGVGKTSIAAATAVSMAAGGKKTMIVSTDAAHSLGDALEMKVTDKPTKVQENLWAQEIDVLASTEKSWGKIQRYFAELLISQNISSVSADELLVFPGLEELFCILEILKHCQGGEYEAVIIDCAPTGETIRLLSFPEVLTWWLEKIFPLEKSLLKVARPLSKPLLGIPLPPEDALDSIAQLIRQLQEAQQMLTDQNLTSVRIVMNPEKIVIKEAARSFMYLNLYGFNVDAVIVNKVLPEEGCGSYFSQWRELQKTYVAQIQEQFSPVPVFKVPLFGEEVTGVPALRNMGNVCFQGRDSIERFYCGQAQRLKQEKDQFVMELALPFVSKGEMALSQQGEELTFRIGGYKRNIFLPRKLIGREVVGANLEDGVLAIKFGDRG
ncbi:ArsA family ATPase [Anaeroarcus burkinensis]|uniref:ArsA family ATPase n=1 Tax=Anaeroarcus burkinensis TaxID=82376 RepID=UPI0003F61AC0|nr:ArsA family ATPase [Anaeroarcus burkinensis]